MKRLRIWALAGAIVAAFAIAPSTAFAQVTPYILQNCLYAPMQSVAVNDTTAGDTQIVAAPGSGLFIHICKVDLSSNGAGTISLESGTGTNCGTSKNVFDGPRTVTAQYGINEPATPAQLYATLPGNAAWCLNLTSSATAGGSVSYVVLNY